MPLIISDILAHARQRLAKLAFQPSTREANLLLAHVTGWSEAQILARQDRSLTERQHRRFELALGRRLTGEPIAYIVGHKEFYGRPFRVDSRVLVPRPETEHLIETALELPLPRWSTVLDLGTGSGCIACTVALELPACRVLATDISLGALNVAQANQTDLGLADRLQLVRTDLAHGLDLTRIDLVLSNPPYIAYDEAKTLSLEIVDFEPTAALFAGSAGLAIHRRLLEELAALRPGAWLVVEIGAGQEEEVRQLAADSAFRLLEVRPDYAGLPRVALLQRR